MNLNCKFHEHQYAGASWKYLFPSNTVMVYVFTCIFWK